MECAFAMTTPPKTDTGIRLAIREEGKFVNAYVAKDDALSDTILLGSVHLQIYHDYPDLFAQWQDLMAQVMVNMLNDFCGAQVTGLVVMPGSPEPCGHA